MDRYLRVLLWVVMVSVALLGGWLYVQSRRAPGLDADAGTAPAGPTPVFYASAEAVIESVQSLSRLETVSYHIEKVITAETGQGPLGFLFGDKVLLIAYGEVIAGIDLTGIGADDVLTTDDGKAYLRLPAAEVFVATLDNERTYVYDRRTGVIGMNPQLETAARQEAERLILEAAMENGIEATAAGNAQAVLQSFLLGLGFKEVHFVDVMPTPTPMPTPTTVSATAAP